MSMILSSKQEVLASNVRQGFYRLMQTLVRPRIRTAAKFLLIAAIASPVHAGDFPLLNESKHPELQAALMQGLEDLSLTNAVAKNQLAVTVIDITDRSNPHLAEVNGDMMMYSASLPKIAILLGAMQKIEDGELVLTPEFEEQLTRMSRHSSNKDASAVFELVGAPYLAELLQSDAYQLYKKDSGGLWVGRPYSRGPVWKRDPINNISHGATSHEVARFYYMLATDRLVSAESCEVMRDVLSEPAIKHKFVSGLLKRYPDAEIMRKSGTWRTYHSDSAIVTRGDREYIVVALANDPNGTKWLEQIALMADQIIFNLEDEV